jgi:hypothetical protein
LLQTILRGNDPEWFEELYRTQENAKTGDAETVWRQWLDEHAAAQNPAGDK